MAYQAAQDRIAQERKDADLLHRQWVAARNAGYKAQAETHHGRA